MTTDETEAFATRLLAAEAARVGEAVEQTGLSRSDLLALALRYYVADNPDRIPAFDSDNSGNGPLEKAGILSAETENNWTAIEEPCTRTHMTSTTTAPTLRTSSAASRCSQLRVDGRRRPRSAGILVSEANEKSARKRSE